MSMSRKKIGPFWIDYDWDSLIQSIKNTSFLVKAHTLAEEQEKKRKLKSTKIKRKNFSKSARKSTLLRQGYRCNVCGHYSDFLDFHHKNGDRSDNDISNCQALCLNCHAKKTGRINSSLKLAAQTFYGCSIPLWTASVLFSPTGPCPFSSAGLIGASSAGLWKCRRPVAFVRHQKRKAGSEFWRPANLLKSGRLQKPWGSLLGLIFNSSS